MKTLIVYEAIPEQTYVAKIDLSAEMYDAIQCAHGNTVNAGDLSQQEEEAILAIGNGFSTNPDHDKYLESDLDKELFMKLKDINGTEKARDLTDVYAMIHCGFAM